MIKNFWTHLNERDRLALSLGGSCCVLYFFYSLLYAPLAQSTHLKYQQLMEKQETLLWMQEVRPQYQTKNHQKTLTDSQLLTVLADQLNQSAFTQYVYQLKQSGAGHIQISFESVPYNAFITWLWSMNEKYTFSIAQLNIEQTPTSGLVKLMMNVATD